MAGAVAAGSADEDLPRAVAPAPVPAPVDLRLAVLGGLLDERAPRLLPAQRAALARELLQAESRSGLPALLLLAVIEQESHFDPEAVGPRGALGLMQVRPFVAAAVAARHHLPYEGPEDLHRPVVNARIGIAFLTELLGEFGDLEVALAAYHVGPTRVRRRVREGWRPRGPYVRRVLARYQALRRNAARLETAIGG